MQSDHHIPEPDIFADIDEDDDWLNSYSCVQSENNQEDWCKACQEGQGDECEFVSAARNALG